MVVPLNSGAAIHLAPGETCDPLDEVETAANPKIEKMSGVGLISLAQTKSKSADRDDSDEPHASRKKSKG